MAFVASVACAAKRLELVLVLFVQFAVNGTTCGETNAANTSVVLRKTFPEVDDAFEDDETRSSSLGRYGWDDSLFGLFFVAKTVCDVRRGIRNGRRAAVL